MSEPTGPAGDVDAGQNLREGDPTPDHPDFAPDLPAGDDPEWLTEIGDV